MTFRDYPDVLKNMTAGNLPESFEATITTRAFTCKDISPIRDLTGIDDFIVIRLPDGDQPGGRMGC